MTEETGASRLVLPATKLHIPPARRELVPRHELVALLVEGASRKLTLLSAPPGSGKTTLLSQWHAAAPGSFAWVSLEEADSDPARFWTLAIDALRTLEPELGGQAEATLRVSGAPIEETALPLLINDFASLERQVVLVLDDYHAIADDRIHHSVAFLLDHLPETMHLAVATRADPPLPLWRMRTRGELTEVRAADLRFSDEEAAALLAEALGLALEPSDVARLQERTEGWAAGLYLAGLSLRGRADTSAFIEAFAGDDRQIVDYLLAEVLDGQPEQMRSFLLRTSILDRLCGGLCDAVIEGEGSAELLERIERSNLFLIPLDSTRSWYRYHHLFAQLLHHELERVEPELLTELHRRAATWHTDEGVTPQAIRHAAAAGETDQARKLIAEHWNTYFNLGRLGTVAGWLDSLPEREVTGDARLCAARAWLALDAAELDEAERWIATAESVLGEGQPELEVDLAVLRAVHAFKVGRVGRAGEAAQRVLDLEPEGATFARTVAHCILGITDWWGGAGAAARPALERAVRLARETENDLAASYALGYLGLVAAELGEPEEAERLADEAAALSEDPGFTEHFVAMMRHLARGVALDGRGMGVEAGPLLERALTLARRGAGAVELAAALVALARVQPSRSEQLLREARDTLASCPDPGVVADWLARAEQGLGGAAGGDELTDRELAVLQLLRSDLSLREIGDSLFVSLNTVKTHTKGIYRKLRASSRPEAVARAREQGLL